MLELQPKADHSRLRESSLKIACALEAPSVRAAEIVNSDTRIAAPASHGERSATARNPPESAKSTQMSTLCFASRSDSNRVAAAPAAATAVSTTSARPRKLSGRWITLTASGCHAKSRSESSAEVTTKRRRRGHSCGDQFRRSLENIPALGSTSTRSDSGHARRTHSATRSMPAPATTMATSTLNCSAPKRTRSPPAVEPIHFVTLAAFTSRWRASPSSVGIELMARLIGAPLYRACPTDHNNKARTVMGTKSVSPNATSPIPQLSRPRIVSRRCPNRSPQSPLGISMKLEAISTPNNVVPMKPVDRPRSSSTCT